ncbi:exodeoxyribonuclease V subunit gamma, partial [Enterobacter hormaechei]|uniref:exodeoxyribonuclease V subunit gamma n=1 Tax=Enterobacter hormaechei TaxID=158836 RepID=UPI001F0ABD75
FKVVCLLGMNDGVYPRQLAPLGFDLMSQKPKRDELAQRLDQERISQRFLAGPVNICTLMPMRSIPFKVVCLLGMNDGVYPRQLAPLGFDLMSQKPKR